MCSLMEPAMALGLVTAVAAPFAAYVFGAEAAPTLHYAMVLAGTWAVGMISIPITGAILIHAFTLLRWAVEKSDVLGRGRKK
jgi:hypothetical protein